MKGSRFFLILIPLLALVVFVSCRGSSSTAVADVQGRTVTQDVLDLHLFLFPHGSDASLFLNDVVIPHYILTIAAEGIVADVEPEEVNAVVTRHCASANKLEDDFFNNAKKKGFSKDAILRVFREKVMITRHLDTVLPEITVSDEEAVSYYESEKEFFAQQGVEGTNEEILPSARLMLIAVKRGDLLREYVEELASRRDIVLF